MGSKGRLLSSMRAKCREMKVGSNPSQNSHAGQAGLLGEVCVVKTGQACYRVRIKTSSAPGAGFRGRKDLGFPMDSF